MWHVIERSFVSPKISKSLFCFKPVCSKIHKIVFCQSEEICSLNLHHKTTFLTLPVAYSISRDSHREARLHDGWHRSFSGVHVLSRGIFDAQLARHADINKQRFGCVSDFRSSVSPYLVKHMEA